MKKSLLAGLMMSVAMLSACSSTDSEPTPANVVQSSNGVRIELEWTTGGTSSDAISNADLDLYLMKGTTEADASRSSYSFESVELEDLYADGEYLLKVYAYRATKKANYTLYVKGDDEGELKSYTGVFLAGDQDLTVEFLKIKKTGTTYSITEL